jgi:hypothetical protein
MVQWFERHVGSAGEVEPRRAVPCDGQRLTRVRGNGVVGQRARQVEGKVSEMAFTTGCYAKASAIAAPATCTAVMNTELST